MKTFEESINEIMAELASYKDANPKLQKGNTKLQTMLKTTNEIIRVFKIVKNNKQWDAGRFAVVWTEQQQEINDLKAELKKCRKGGGDTSELFGGDTSGDEGQNDHEPTEQPTPKKPDADIFRQPLQ